MRSGTSSAGVVGAAGVLALAVPYDPNYPYYVVTVEPLRLGVDSSALGQAQRAAMNSATTQIVQRLESSVP